MSSSSSDDEIDDLTNQTANIQMKDDNSKDYTDFYKQAIKVGYARLEKGLLLFIYLHESSNATRVLDKRRNRELCYFTLTNKNCPKKGTSKKSCKLDHIEAYRQPNICKNWYQRRHCSLKQDCDFEHHFRETDDFIYLYNRTDVIVWNLIRFIRNFAGHFIPSFVDMKNIQSLYQEIIIIMVHIISCATHDIDKIILFLLIVTIKQFKPDFLKTLAEETSYKIPDFCLNSNSIDFKSNWYDDWLTKSKTTPNYTKINFTDISDKYRCSLAKQFQQYYEERLKNRGAKLDDEFEKLMQHA